MKIFFHCYGGTHSSVVAASLYLNKIPVNPTLEQIKELTYFDNVEEDDIGKPIFLGIDKNENDVYVIGMKNKKEVVKKAIMSTFEIYGISRSEIMFVDSMECIGLLTRIGGFLSRKIGVKELGKNLAALGIAKKNDCFTKIKSEVVTSIENTSS